MDASNEYYDDFKRSRNDDEDVHELDGNLKNYDYIKELIKERNQLDSESHASRLLEQGKIQVFRQNIN